MVHVYMPITPKRKTSFFHIRFSTDREPVSPSEIARFRTDITLSGEGWSLTHEGKTAELNQFKEKPKEIKRTEKFFRAFEKHVGNYPWINVW